MCENLGYHDRAENSLEEMLKDSSDNDLRQDEHGGLKLSFLKLLMTENSQSLFKYLFC